MFSLVDFTNRFSTRQVTHASLGVICCHLCYASAANADDIRLTNSYDASQFSASPFRDTTFDRHDYRELRKKGTGGESRADTRMLNVRRRKGTLGINAGGENTNRAGERQSFEKEKKFGAISELAGDWVPDSIDLTSNGGFSDAPFNGSPVPYTLNGHVDPERGKP